MGDELIRYVSRGAQGNDANNGFTLNKAKATLQNAYDSLPAGGGVIEAEPARHDVGTGLRLRRTKPVHIKGPGMWTRIAGNVPQWDTGGGVILFASGATQSLVSFPDPVAPNNGNGFEFRNLVFEVKAGMPYGIRANSVNRTVVEDCGFHMRNPQGVGISLTHDGVLGDDASWWRVSKNTCYGGRFMETLAQYQHNQLLIADNECLQGSVAGVGTFITLRGGHRCVIRDNNLEGDTVSPYMLIDGSWGCETRGNGGEGGVGLVPQVFIRLVNSNRNLLSDMGVSYPGPQDKIYERINSSDNVIVNATHQTVG